MGNKIYAYKSPLYKGIIKVGETTRDVYKRICEEFPQQPCTPEFSPFEILLEEEAIDNNGKTFSDKDVHKELKRMGIENVSLEWFRVDDIQIIREAIDKVKKNNKDNYIPYKKDIVKKRLKCAVPYSKIFLTIEDLTESEWKNSVSTEFSEFEQLLLRTLNSRKLSLDDRRSFGTFPVFLILYYIISTYSFDEQNDFYEYIIEDFPNLESVGFPLYIGWLMEFLRLYIHGYCDGVIYGEGVQNPTLNSLIELKEYYTNFVYPTVVKSTFK